MRKLILSLAVGLTATAAVAQGRPQSVRMSCAQARGLVAASGAIVLGTGGFTYDRFVADGRFCQFITEVTEPAWVPTVDTPQCFVGYRCKEVDKEDFFFRR